MGNQPGRLTVQELWKLWKLHTKLLAENRMVEPAANKKITSALDLKFSQFVLVKNQCKGPFNPTFIYNHQVAKVLNDSTVLFITLDGKEKKCNIHHMKPVSSIEVHMGSQAEFPEGAFPKFWDSSIHTSSCTNASNVQHSYNLRSKHKHDMHTFSPK